MGYQIRAFCAGIKNENIQFVIHFDVIIYHIRIILTEKELIFVVYVTQTVHTLTIVKRKYSQTTVHSRPAQHFHNYKGVCNVTLFLDLSSVTSQKKT